MNSSNDLKEAQTTIEKRAAELMLAPEKGWDLISQYIEVLKDIDQLRRDVWDEEKFGVYNDMAQEAFYNETLDEDFTIDDIPF